MRRLRARAAAALVAVTLLAGAARSAPQPEPAAPAAEPALTLAEAIALAAANNEVPGIAQARLERAAALRRQAIATLMPELTFTGTYTRRPREVTREVNGEELVIQSRDALLGTAEVEGTLFDARAFPLVRSTGYGLRAQEFASAELDRGLAFEVSQTFLAVLSAERLRAAAARRIGVAEATVSDARIRLDAGLAAANDVTRSDLELASARLSLIQAESAVRNSRLALAYLIGEPVEARPLAEPAIAAPEGRDAAALEEAARGAREDLRALEQLAEAARLRAREPRLRVVPTLDLRGTTRTTNETGLSGRETDWNVAALLTWELFDGGVRQAEAAVRDAEHVEAQLTAAALSRRIGLEVRTALADRETARGALAQGEAQAEVARQNAVEVRERFANGLATALERADAAVAEFEAEAELARQRFALEVAELTLVQTLGQWPIGEPPGEPSAGAPGEEP